jgi:hypothetical protein
VDDTHWCGIQRDGQAIVGPDVVKSNRRMAVRGELECEAHVALTSVNLVSTHGDTVGAALDRRVGKDGGRRRAGQELVV